jgi:uncharacterized membrane protein
MLGSIISSELSQTRTSLETDSLKPRIQSVDFLRGLVMVLMAIDHVRVYSGLPAGGPEAGIFFTRWITHFCAPVFVFLTGTSAYLYGKKLNDRSALAKYLLSRAVLLIVLEFTVIRFFWTFNLNFGDFMLAGVIWMIGACMIMLAGLIYLKPYVVGIIGLAIMLFQNFFALVPNLLPESTRTSFGSIWEYVYTSGFEAPKAVTILYVLVPWIGVMAAGYGFGIFFGKSPNQRRRILIALGAGCTVLFLIVGSIVATKAEGEAPFIFKLLNQRKYPASQLYLLMTLGPAILLLPFVENARGLISSAIITFGRVPFFYYLAHILLIHLTAIAVNLIREGRTFSEWYATAPYVWFAEEGHQWKLSMLYIVFVIDVAILLLLCRWYERYKFTHPEQKWLRYI